jgi:hypothetical protein
LSLIVLVGVGATSFEYPARGEDSERLQILTSHQNWSCVPGFLVIIFPSWKNAESIKKFSGRLHVFSMQTDGKYCSLNGESE